MLYWVLLDLTTTKKMNKSHSNKTMSINNAVASARMEGLDPTPEDIELIKQLVEHKITKDELIEIILKQVREESSNESF